MAATSRIAVSACVWSISRDVFRDSQFKVFRGALAEGGVVKAINAKNFAGITIGQVDELTAIAKNIRRKRARFHQSGKRGMEIADREIFL